MKIIIVICVSLLLSGCQITPGKIRSGTFQIVIKSVDESDSEEYFLYFQAPYIDGYSIPQKLKNDLNDSLRWKWLNSDSPPNTCFVAKTYNSNTGSYDYDIGLAMLELTKTQITGSLYRFPDAGMNVNLVIDENNLVTGTTEWWGGVWIVVDVDEDGNRIDGQEDIPNENSGVRHRGKKQGITSINQCFEHMIEVLPKLDK